VAGCVACNICCTFAWQCSSILPACQEVLSTQMVVTMLWLQATSRTSCWISAHCSVGMYPQALNIEAAQCRAHIGMQCSLWHCRSSATGHVLHHPSLGCCPMAVGNSRGCCPMAHRLPTEWATLLALKACLSCVVTSCETCYDIVNAMYITYSKPVAYFFASLSFLHCSECPICMKCPL
jgi:hypothetical protein